MDFTYSLISAFAIGFLGSVHCIGMCGGISGALATAIIPPKGKQSRWLEVSRKLGFQFLYSTGRVTSYAMAGALAGYLGHQLTQAAPHHGISVLRAFAGAMIILLGFYITGWWMLLTKLERVGTLLWKRIAPWTRKLMPVNSYPKAFVLGVLWGWLPCGLVYSALTWSIGTGDALQGALLMVYFGLGTLPAMIGVGLFANILGDIARSRAMRSLVGILLILYGCWTIWGLLPLIHH